MFTNLYILTTDPNFQFKNVMYPKIMYLFLLSIAFHTFIYAIFINLISYVFYNKFLSHSINLRLILVLLLIMIFGYIGRILHVKEIYKSFNYNQDKTTDYINQHYNSWIFAG